MFTLKITYTTGDSFNTEYGKVDYVGHVWDDFAIAKEAGRAIKAHYEAYKSYNKYGSHPIKPTGKEPWYVQHNDEDYWQYMVKVPDGKGGNVHLNAFWCGYFECLEDVEVHIDGRID